MARWMLAAALSFFISLIAEFSRAAPKMLEGGCQSPPHLVANLKFLVEQGAISDYKIYRGRQAKAIYDALVKLRSGDIYQGDLIIKAGDVLYFGGMPPAGSFCYFEKFPLGDLSKLPL